MTVFRIGLLLTLMLFNEALTAEALETVSASLIGERPNPAGPPTPISIGIYVFDIDEINDVEQRFNIDFFADVGWQDPRLALPEEERQGMFRSLPLEEVWTPRVLVVNDRGLSPQLPRVVEVDDFGNVEYRQRLSGELASDLIFKEFPFDTQLLPVEVISYQYSPDEVSFSLNADISGDDGSFSVEGWELNILEPSVGEFTIPAERTVRPQLTFFVEAKRETRYYLFTMFLPMSLIVFMGWTVFWLQPNIVPSRIAISTASIFSLIAFGFSIRLSLPAVSYMTRADLFVTGCTLLLFLALGVAVLGSRWASADRMEEALRVNAVARWAYIGLYCLVTTGALTL